MADHAGFGADQRGMVTVEVALASLLLAGVLAGAIGVVAGGFRLAQCQVVANEVARQSARGDVPAVNAAVADRPDGTVVTTRNEGDLVVVRVQCDAEVAGVAVPLEASAQVVSEP